MPRRAPPIHPAVVRGIAGLAWVQGRLDVALGILIGFHCMLRGCEVLRLGFCDCMHFCNTTVLDLGFTKTGSRKGTREQVTVTDSSVTNLFRYFCRDGSSSEHLVCMSPCNFGKYFSRLLSFFSLGSEGFSLHSLRRGGATHFFRVTGNLSATLERARWLSVSSGRLYINEKMSILAHCKIRPATATALRTAEALPCKGLRISSLITTCIRKWRRVGECYLWPRGVSEAKAAPAQRSQSKFSMWNMLGNATSDHERCLRQR